MKNLYEITEISKRKIERYVLKMTREEVTAWCKMKRAAYGGSRVDGGDPSYECFAVLLN